MKKTSCSAYTAFDGFHRIASGSLASVALAVQHAIDGGSGAAIRIFDNATGYPVDLPGSGRLDGATPAASQSDCDAAEIAGASADARAARIGRRGRPKLGVVPREITLLPRQWEWLASQPGGASAVLRGLVEERLQADASIAPAYTARVRAYHFMSAIAGGLPGFENAVRALFADELSRLSALIADWPKDVRNYIQLVAELDRQ